MEPLKPGAIEESKVVAAFEKVTLCEEPRQKLEESMEIQNFIYPFTRLIIFYVVFESKFSYH